MSVMQPGLSPEAQTQVATLIRALGTLLDPTVTSDVRRAAERYTDDFRTSPSALPISLELVHAARNYPDDVRLFGLNTLEHIIATQWNAWPRLQQDQVQAALFALATEGMRDADQERRMIRDKLAKLVVGVALRSWPQQWPGLWASLEAMLVSGQSGHVRTAIGILRTLAEEVFIYAGDRLDDSRRAELKGALVALAPAVLKALMPLLTEEARRTRVTSPPAPTSSVILLEGIALLAAYIEWLPFKPLDEAGLAGQLCHWLELGPDVLDACLDALLVLVNRVPRMEEQKLFNPLLEAMPNLSRLISTLSATTDEEAYNRLKRVAQLLVELGLHQVCYRKTTLLTPQLAVYLETLLFLSRHTSDLVSSLAMQFWNQAFKCENVHRHALFVAVLPQLVSLVTTRLVVNQRHLKAVSPSVYYHLDFDSPAEYEQFLSATKNRLYEILRSLSKHRPADMLAYACQALEELGRTPYSSETVGADLPAGCSPKSHFYQVLDGTIMFVDAVLFGLGAVSSHEESTQPALMASLRRIVDLCLAFDRPDPLCQARMLEGLTHAAVTLRDGLTQLGAIMNKILPLITFGAGASPGSSAHAERVLALRRKAASSLVKIGGAFATQLIPFYANLAAEIQRLLALPGLGLGERSSLIEFMLVLCNSAGSDDDRASTYRLICEPLLTEWAAPDLDAALNSHPAFFAYSGIGLLVEGPSACTPSALDAAQARRSKLLYLVNTSLVVFKRLLPEHKGEPLREQNRAAAGLLISRVLPPLLRLIHTLQGLWNPASLSPAMRAQLIALTNDEKRVLLGLGGFDRAEDPSETPADKLAIELHIWLANLRQFAYLTIMTSTLYGDVFFGCEALWPAAWPCLFDSLAHMEHRHLKYFIEYIIEPLVLRCPEALLETRLRPWLPGLFGFLGSRMDADWRTLRAVVQGSASSSRHEDDDGDGSISDELVADRTLRSTTHSLAHLVFDMYVPMAERYSNLPKTHTLESLPPLVRYLLATPDVAEASLTLALRFFAWQDTFSCDKAIQICQRLVQYLSGRAEYLAFLGQSVTVAALQTLSDGYHQELHEPVLALLVSVLTVSRVEAEAVLRAVPALAGDGLTGFLAQFDAEESPKKRKVLLRGLLKPIMGLKSSSLFRLDESAGIKSLPTRLILKMERDQQDTKGLFDALGDNDSLLAGLPEFFQS